MLEEPADELQNIQGHGPYPFAAVFYVGEGHDPVLDTDDFALSKGYTFPARKFGRWFGRKNRRAFELTWCSIPGYFHLTQMSVENVRKLQFRVGPSKRPRKSS